MHASPCNLAMLLRLGKSGFEDIVQSQVVGAVQPALGGHEQVIHQFGSYSETRSVSSGQGGLIPKG